MISGSVGSRVSLTVRQHEDGLVRSPSSTVAREFLLDNQFGLQGGRPVTVDLVRIASDKLVNYFCSGGRRFLLWLRSKPIDSCVQIAGHQLYDKLGTLLRMTAGHENGTEDFVNKLAVGVTGAPASPRPGTPRGSTHSSSGAINGEVRNGLEESRNLLRTLLRAVFSEERGVDDGMLREKQRVRSLTNRLKQTLSDRPRSLGPRSGVQRDAQVDREREEERLRMEEEQLRMVQTIQELSNRVGELNLQLQVCSGSALHAWNTSDDADGGIGQDKEMQLQLVEQEEQPDKDRSKTQQIQVPAPRPLRPAHAGSDSGGAHGGSRRSCTTCMRCCSSATLRTERARRCWSRSCSRSARAGLNASRASLHHQHRG